MGEVWETGEGGRDRKRESWEKREKEGKKREREGESELHIYSSRTNFREIQPQSLSHSFCLQ